MDLLCFKSETGEVKSVCDFKQQPKIAFLPFKNKLIISDGCIRSLENGEIVGKLAF